MQRRAPADHAYLTPAMPLLMLWCLPSPSQAPQDRGLSFIPICSKSFAFPQAPSPPPPMTAVPNLDNTASLSFPVTARAALDCSKY